MVLILLIIGVMYMIGCTKPVDAKSVGYVVDTNCVNRVQRLEWEVDQLKERQTRVESENRQLRLELDETKGEY